MNKATKLKLIPDPSALFCQRKIQKAPSPISNDGIWKRTKNAGSPKNIRIKIKNVIKLRLNQALSFDVLLFINNY
ncbi:hypothetical protein NIES267_39920 [Calothrix parasitica NIES-267]|uniref:Uncharacterized protein n=1 Tax=Calothrix parasitica NIES-267 TaxID=1973488 RepID=A0A1Z4LTC5_9CYAN|nr:hypothetical protein NIES267_39920 [Calothrix parasitica NIES-267]